MKNKNAEFAITVRKCAMGKGYSVYGMNEIIRLGFEKYNLETIYWYVSKRNARAIRFYEKNGYKEMDCNTILSQGEKQVDDFKWFAIQQSESLCR